MKIDLVFYFRLGAWWIDTVADRLAKDMSPADKEVKGCSGGLGNPHFADKGSIEVVADPKANRMDDEA
jgi:hypothetical protein